VQPGIPGSNPGMPGNRREQCNFDQPLPPGLGIIFLAKPLALPILTILSMIMERCQTFPPKASRGVYGIIVYRPPVAVSGLLLQPFQFTACKKFGWAFYSTWQMHPYRLSGNPGSPKPPGCPLTGLPM